MVGGSADLCLISFMPSSCLCLETQECVSKEIGSIVESKHVNSESLQSSQKIPQYY